MESFFFFVNFISFCGRLSVFFFQRKEVHKIIKAKGAKLHAFPWIRKVNFYYNLVCLVSMCNIRGRRFYTIKLILKLCDLYLDKKY